MRRMTLFLALVLVVAGCHQGGPPDVGAPVNPHPVGEAVTVGGWFPVETVLDEGSPAADNPGDEQATGWTVLVIAPSEPCPGDPTTPQKETVCVGLEITGDASQPGGLRIRDGLPLLVDSAGGTSDLTRLHIAGTSDWTDLGEAVGLASDCTFSAPDDGRQAANCTALVFVERRSGIGGEESAGWVTVGVGKTAHYDLEYIVGGEGSGRALRWPDGTWLSIP